MKLGRCGECAVVEAKRRRAPRSAANRYDWVLVERVLSGRAVDRRLTRLEKAELVRLLLREGQAIKGGLAAGVIGDDVLQRWVSEFKPEALEIGLTPKIRLTVPLPELVL